MEASRPSRFTPTTQGSWVAPRACLGAVARRKATDHSPARESALVVQPVACCLLLTEIPSSPSPEPVTLGVKLFIQVEVLWDVTPCSVAV